MKVASTFMCSFWSHSSESHHKKNICSKIAETTFQMTTQERQIQHRLNTNWSLTSSHYTQIPPAHWPAFRNINLSISAYYVRSTSKYHFHQDKNQYQNTVPSVPSVPSTLKAAPRGWAQRHGRVPFAGAAAAGGHRGSEALQLRSLAATGLGEAAGTGDAWSGGFWDG